METSESKIKAGILISYDYPLLVYSLPCIYSYVDEIYLAIDKKRKTWKGYPFYFPNTFVEWIQAIDKMKKIHFYEDSFYIPSLPPMTLETRTRNMLAKQMGYNGWHVQIDADEYFCDFKHFAYTLKSLDIKEPVSIYAQWITLIKQDETGYFYIKKQEKFPVATNMPYYLYARIPALERKDLILNDRVIHQSWARSEEEIKQKIRNWGHCNDFDSNTFLSQWESINLSNYQKIRNFHPLTPPSWPKLNHIKARNVFELIKKLKKKS